MTPRFFPMRHDWAEPFRVTREFSTDVQVAVDGSEVRAQRRASPNISVAMRGAWLSEIGAGQLLAAFRGATRPLSYYAPLWCDTTELTAAVTAGDAIIQLDTTTRPFFALNSLGTGYAMLWRSEANAELVSYSEVEDSLIVLDANTVNSYAVAGTRVVPVRPMWLTLPVRLNWLNGVISTADLDFVDQREQVGFGIDGSDNEAVAASVKIFVHSNDLFGEGFTGQANYYLYVEATVFDAAGIPIPGAAVEWTSSMGVTVTPTINSRLARVSGPGSVTATSGVATATIGV